MSFLTKNCRHQSTVEVHFNKNTDKYDIICNLCRQAIDSEIDYEVARNKKRAINRAIREKDIPF